MAVYALDDVLITVLREQGEVVRLFSQVLGLAGPECGCPPVARMRMMTIA